MLENLIDSFLNINRIIFVLIFLGYATVDLIFSKYTHDVIDLKPFSAANSSAAIYLLLALGILSYTENVWYILPMLLWSWIGTFCYVKYKKNKAEKQEN